MNYEWTPISEPPDSDIRWIVIWVKTPDLDIWFRGFCRRGVYYTDDFKRLSDRRDGAFATHWKDIEPPK